MVVIAFDHGDAVPVVEAHVQLLYLSEGFASSFNREKIQHGGRYHDGPGIHHQQQTWMVHAIRNHAE